jgi:8-oxo-dGTP pyrophosphatase MutT (NUDIX family)
MCADTVDVTARSRAEVRLHSQIRDVLSIWQAPDSQQERLRVEFLAHLGDHPSGMVRDCRAGHLTASALVVEPTSKQVLLTLHPVVGRWLQTGGHIEYSDESPEESALREAREESGIASLTLLGAPVRLDRHTVLCKAPDGQRSALDHFDVQWVALAPPHSTPIRSSESVDLAWWPWADLPTGPSGADDSVAALVAAARTHLSH